MTFSAQAELSYEQYYREHVDLFSAFLRRTLGTAREGAGGRIGVADTLQDAMMHAASHWPELQDEPDAERDKRMYQYLQDAAGEALRREHGRASQRHPRPQMISYDFGQLSACEGEPSRREQELTTAVLGVMAENVASAADASVRREVLDGAVLLAALRALSRNEALAFVGGDYLQRDQQQVAAELGLELGAFRSTLFEARRVFYGLMRHAAGFELDEEERGQLHAYQAGELSGRERRVARRHLQHCEGCQRLVRETQRFGEQAQRVLAPLPFVAGGKVLLGHPPTNATTTSIPGVGAGLFGQPGAAKALAVTVGFLTVGVGLGGWLAEAQDTTGKVRSRTLSAFDVGTVPAHAPVPQPKKPAATKPKHTSRAKHRLASRPSSTSPSTPTAATVPVAASPPTPPVTTSTAPPAAAATSAPKSSSGGGEFFGQGG